MKICDSGSFCSLSLHHIQLHDRSKDTDLSHLVEEVRLARNKLYREIYDKQLHSKAEQFQFLSVRYIYSIFFFHSTFEEIPWAMDTFDLNSNANLGHLSIFYRFPVVRPTIRNYDISKTFLCLFFLSNATNLLYINNYYSSSCIKRNSENIESLINKGTSIIHANFNEILHDFSSI